MNTFFLILKIVCAAWLILALAVVLFLNWIARGEPDVNGDPERDAFGLSPEEPIKTVCAWCPDQRVISGDPRARITSHGICTDCAEKVSRKNTEPAEATL